MQARAAFFAPVANQRSERYQTQNDYQAPSQAAPALAALALAAGAAVSADSITGNCFSSCEEEPVVRTVSGNAVPRTASMDYRRMVTARHSNNRLVLAADCGGTNTRLMLYSVDPADAILEKQLPPGRLLKEVKYPNVLFKSLDAIIQIFLADECLCGIEIPYPEVAVLAVAGVVAQNTVRYTNLDWVVNGFELQDNLNIERVEIINDFVAQGYGALTLDDDEVISVNDAKPVPGAPIACIGAGTGLGECFLVSDLGGDYRCYPSEGGHAEFSPRGLGNDQLQIELLKHLRIKFSGWNRISVERVVSGKGICNVYEFLAYHHPNQINKEVHRKFRQDPENAGIIAMNAVPGSLCEQAMQIFADCYGSQVGTLALHFMPFRGIYITGGVTQKSLGFLQADTSFLDAYHDKGRVSPLLHRVPLYFVKSDDMGQRGAHYRAVQLLKRKLAGHKPRVAEDMPDMSPDDLPAPRELDNTTAESLQEEVHDLEPYHERLFHGREAHEKRNRRMPVPETAAASYEPIFKGDLHKVLKVGSRDNKDDWIKRTMWISKNGALVYRSQEEDRDLIYWTAEDLRNADVSVVKDGDAIMPFVFKVSPAPRDGFTFACSEFAAESAEAREAWTKKIQEVRGSFRSKIG